MRLLLLSVMTILLFGFQNCSPKMAFKAQESQQQVEQTSQTPVVVQSVPPASVVPRVVVPPLTLLQRAQARCPVKATVSGQISWNKLDWNLAVNDVSKAPPCVIQGEKYYGMYFVDKCSNAGFTDIGEKFNVTFNFQFSAVDYVSNFNFPSSTGSITANIKKLDQYFVKTLGGIFLNSLQIDKATFEGSPCVWFNDVNRMEISGYSNGSSSSIALFGEKYLDIKGAISTLHLKNDISHHAYIIDADIQTLKIDGTKPRLSLKNSTIKNLCTVSNIVVLESEESGVENYISDPTDVRCNP